MEIAGLWSVRPGHFSAFILEPRINICNVWIVGEIFEILQILITSHSIVGRMDLKMVARIKLWYFGGKCNLLCQFNSRELILIRVWAGQLFWDGRSTVILMNSEGGLKRLEAFLCSCFFFNFDGFGERAENTGSLYSSSATPRWSTMAEGFFLAFVFLKNQKWCNYVSSVSAKWFLVLRP